MTELNDLKISPGAIVCQDCELVGDITIGARTVVHPKAKIMAISGPIIIGENNIIEERTVIVNQNPDSNIANTPVMIIGNNNVFEVDSFVESLKIGDSNIVESKAKVGRQTYLSNGCVIGAACNVDTSEVVPEQTVIYGSSSFRRHQSDKPSSQILQIDFLSKVLPNYHHIRKTKKNGSSSS
nr:EOG090X0I48 [Lepidurus arcticus]